ncbi:MAG: hypothetical protein GDA38_27630 [Hormoscilla sp. SP12CHS1]|nr:hypothetical protein [Hormoscilla sp. SP12CHS1]
MDRSSSKVMLDNNEWIRALGLIESNSRALAALSDRVQSERRENRQRIESNSRAIAALGEKVTDTEKTDLELIKANSKAIGNLTQVLCQLQDGQAMLTKLLSEQQELLKEFREIVKEILKRLEQSQTQTNEDLETIAHELIGMRDVFLKMQQGVLSMLPDEEQKQQSQSDG